MMIKRYGTIDISEWYIHISRNTDTNRSNTNSIPVYFDAAFSRRVVKERVVEGGYTLIKELVTKGVLVPEINNIALIYDPATISAERGYDNINKYLEERGNDVSVITGKCECSYDPEHESITVTIQNKEKIN